MKLKTTKLWLRSTCRYPAPEMFVLCRTALESIERSLSRDEKLYPIIVKLTNSSHAYCGRAYWTENEPRKKVTVLHDGRPGYTNWHGIVWRRVLVRIGPPERFAVTRTHTYPKFKDMPEMELRSYREAVVAVTAHEIGHTLGYSGRKSGEEKCELCAIDALDYYRKHQIEIDAEIERELQQMTQKDLAERNAKSPIQIAGKRYLEAKTKLAQWQRKAKLAATKIKIYTRLLKRREREMNRQGWIDYKLAGVDLAQPGSEKMVQQVTQLVDTRLAAIDERDRLAATAPPTQT
jgi:alpha-D-ribose 1-methylphosphonate 5-triphosphate synthase subunit PhnG